MGDVSRAFRVTGRYGGSWVLILAVTALGVATYVAPPESMALVIVVSAFFAVVPLGISLVVLAAVRDDSSPLMGDPDRPYELGPADVER